MGDFIMTIEALNTIETLPTAYSEDVNKFYKRGCKKKRNILMKQIKEKQISKGINFNYLFPPMTVRKDVLSHVLLMLSNTGMCVIASKTLADNVKCSVRTVTRAVKAIKETGEIIVTGLANGKNKYVFVLKSHENFKCILQEVFYMDLSEVVSEDVSTHETATNVDTATLKDNFSGVQSIKSFRSLSSKHEKSFIQKAIENNVIQGIEKTESVADAEVYLSQYIDNPIQLQLFRTIHDMPFPEVVKRQASVLTLRAGLYGEVTQKTAIKAIQVLTKITRYMIDRVEIKSIKGTFTYEMFNSKANSVMATGGKVDKVESVRKVEKVQFYNWLVEKE